MIPAAMIASSVLPSLLGGGKGGSYSGPPVYTPTGLTSADQSWQEILKSMQPTAQAIPATVNPILLQALQSQLGIDYSPMIKAGQTAGQQYSNLAQQQGESANQYLQSANLMGKSAQDILKSGFDPQKDLYESLFQENVDKTRAAQAARGLGVSPLGAALEAESNKNFAADWQNQQLARQARAIVGAGQASTIQNMDLSQMIAMLTGQPQSTMAAGTTPVTAMQQAFGAPAQSATQYSANVGATMQPGQSLMNQIIPYMNYGAGAQNLGMHQNIFDNQALQNQYANQMNLGLYGIQKAGEAGAGDWIKSLFSPNYGTTAQQNWAQAGGWGGVEALPGA